MDIGDRVKHDPAFISKYGADFPFDPNDEGTIESKGITARGKTVYEVAWDSKPHQVPQVTPETWIIRC